MMFCEMLPIFQKCIATYILALTIKVINERIVQRYYSDILFALCKVALILKDSSFGYHFIQFLRETIPVAFWFSIHNFNYYFHLLIFNSYEVAPPLHIRTHSHCLACSTAYAW